MKQTTVTLNNGNVLNIRNSNRTIMLFEEMTAKSIHDIEGFKDTLIWLYCTLKGCNRLEFTLEFEDFIDLLDENPQLMIEFVSFNSSNETTAPETKKKAKV